MPSGAARAAPTTSRRGRRCMVVVEVRETKRWRWGRWNIYTVKVAHWEGCGARTGKPGMEGRGVKHGRCMVLRVNRLYREMVGQGRRDRGTTDMHKQFPQEGRQQ